jgi:Ca2+/Na+ antiporter
MVYIFLIVKYVTNSSDNRFTIETVDIFVGMMPISHTFVGLTMACWGGNISDIMNASIAAINKKTEFATSSIIGSQIINL